MTKYPHHFGMRILEYKPPVAYEKFSQHFRHTQWMLFE